MSRNQQLYLQKLRDHGLSDTGPRRRTFEVLHDAGHRPLSISELIRRLAPEIDRATIYRIISAFEKSGITRRINTGWKYKIELSEDFHGHHHHLICSNCGKVAIITDDEEINRMLHKIAHRKHFTLENHSIEIQGKCGKCDANAFTV